MATVFITGATGFTGREVVREAKEQGLEVIAHVRPDSSRLPEWRERFEALGATVDTTAWDGAAMRETFARVKPDVVFSLTGTTTARMKATRHAAAGAETFESVDFGLRKLLVDALKEAAVPARFVELSTVGVGPRSPSRYMRTRWQTEEYIRQSGLPFTIVRPGFIIGPGRDDRRTLEYCGAAMVNGVAVTLGAIGFKAVGARYRSIRNVDLAAALVRLATAPEAQGQVVDGKSLHAAATVP